MTTVDDVCARTEQRVPASDETFQYIDIASIDRKRKIIATPTELTGSDAPSRARKVVRTGDTIVSMTRPNLNAVALVPDALDHQIASTGFEVLRPTAIDPRWLYYTVRTRRFVDAMSELVQGALYPAVGSSDVRGHTIPLAPLNEQSRVADKLDAMFARIDACRDQLDRVPALLKAVRADAILSHRADPIMSQGWEPV